MLSRQVAKLTKKDLLPISPNLGAFASLRETQFFPILSLSQNFKYLWLDFGLQIHRITRSALANTFGGIVRPICLAVLRLITNSNFVGRSTGRSAGLVPLRILST